MLDGKHNVTRPCNAGEYIGNVADHRHTLRTILFQALFEGQPEDRLASFSKRLTLIHHHPL
jgi:hypothetical protein